MPANFPFSRFSFLTVCFWLALALLFQGCSVITGPGMPDDDDGFGSKDPVRTKAFGSKLSGTWESDCERQTRGSVLFVYDFNPDGGNAEYREEIYSNNNCAENPTTVNRHTADLTVVGVENSNSTGTVKLEFRHTVANQPASYTLTFALQGTSLNARFRKIAEYRNHRFVELTEEEVRQISSFYLFKVNP